MNRFTKFLLAWIKQIFQRSPDIKIVQYFTYTKLFWIFFSIQLIIIRIQKQIRIQCGVSGHQKTFFQNLREIKRINSTLFPFKHLLLQFIIQQTNMHSIQQSICSDDYVKQLSDDFNQDVSVLNIKKGPWKEFEDRVYQEFIQEHEESFQCQFYRRSNQVFKVLSQILKNGRTAQQCKSHHERMKQMTKNGSIQQIIDYLNKKYQKKSKKALKKPVSSNTIIADGKKKNEQPTKGAETEKNENILKQGEVFRAIFNDATRSVQVKFELDALPNW